MAYTGASLADGQIAASWAAIYTVPGSTVAIVKAAELYNTGSSAQTIDIGITRSGGTRRQMRKLVLATNESSPLLTDGEILVLSAGDTLDAQSTNATTVDYVIMGATE